jgi:dihydroflavonol-4-reductase
MSSALVTGATGFVGMWVARQLIKEKMSVRVLARPNSDRRNLAGLTVEVVEGDLRDPVSLQTALQGCEELYHVAAYYSTSEADGPLMYKINVGGTKSLLKAARRAGVQRIVYTSTIGTIGRPADGSLPTEDDEFNLWDSSSHYARSKHLAEVIALSLAQDGMPIVIVNPCAPVGAGDIKPSSSGRRILDYLSGRTPSFLEGGINFVSVRDVALGHVLAARRGQAGRRYILGNAQGNLMRADFYRLMQEVTDIQPPRAGGRNSLKRLGPALSAPARGKQPAALTCNPARAINELGLPQTPIDDALSEAVDWFRANGYVR